jgi:predicted alpha/beta hydrolase
MAHIPSQTAGQAPAHTAVHTETLTLTAADGYRLQALRYSPTATGASAGCQPLRGRLIVAGATGVPQRFYRRFAEHAVARGLEVLTLDYRGIGLSKPASLRGFQMDYLDWARQDIAAAVDLMSSPDDLPLFMVGHSYGGHAFGLLPNHQRVARFYTFATGAGWHGWMPRAEQLRVQLMWRVMGPLLVRWKGYLNWSVLGMGEDLPKPVFLQWRRWCRNPRYFFEDPDLPGLAERFAQVKTPIVAANALDDLWAPPASRDAFMQHYRGTTVEPVTLDPRQLGLGPIGHMGYFRDSARPLWDTALQWLLQHPKAGHAALSPSA